MKVSARQLKDAIGARVPIGAGAVGAAGVCLFLCAGSARAASCDEWTREGGGEWNTASAWSSGLPSENSKVCIDRSVKVTLGGYTPPTLASLEIGEATSAGTAQLELANNDSLKVSEGLTIGSKGALILDGTASVKAGSVTNGGSVTAEGGQQHPVISGDFVNNGELTIAAGTHLDQGSGKFTNSGNFVPQISGSGAGALEVESGASFNAGGTLKPTPTGGFTPSGGQEYDVVLTRGGTWSGSFASVANGFTGDYSHKTYIGAVYGKAESKPTGTTHEETKTVHTEHHSTVRRHVTRRHARLKVLGTRFVAGRIRISLACSAGAGSCPDVGMRVSVIEHLSHGRLVALSARRHSATRKRLAILARGRTSLRAGSHRNQRLALDHAGRALLRRHRHFKALLKVTQGRRKVASRQVTI